MKVVLSQDEITEAIALYLVNPVSSGQAFAGKTVKMTFSVDGDPVKLEVVVEEVKDAK